MNAEQKKNYDKMLFLLNGLSLPKLKELIELAYNDYREGVGMVFLLALNVLGEKVSEKEYVEYLNKLGA